MRIPKLGSSLGRNRLDLGPVLSRRHDAVFTQLALNVDYLASAFQVR